MVSKSASLILKNVLKRISPSETELKRIDDFLKEFMKDFEKAMKNQEIDAEIFVGGSYAKKTVVRRDQYDVDIFIRFDKKYKEENISELTEKILKVMKKDFKVIHGSRDYFRINAEAGMQFYLEIIPVIKVKNPREALNITDLSYSHVNYVKKKIKNKKVLDEIRLAKEFTFANHSYGAESYIKGFSGYGLELMVYKFGSFLNFIKELVKTKPGEKLIIDIEKLYKNKKEIMMNINSSKLQSPIILIDPVFKQRNVLAALSEETFQCFKKVCRDFLKSPGEEFFEVHKTDLEKIKNNAKKNKYDFVLMQVSTNKQEGDIAGSKLLKFYNHLSTEIGKLFDIKDRGFNYNDKKDVECFFVVKSKGEILVEGPEIKMQENLKLFKKAHKSYFIKKGRVYSKEKVGFNLKGFIRHWKNKNAGKMKDMSIVEMKLM